MRRFSRWCDVRNTNPLNRPRILFPGLDPGILVLLRPHNRSQRQRLQALRQKTRLFLFNKTLHLRKARNLRVPLHAARAARSNMQQSNNRHKFHKLLIFPSHSRPRM